MYISNIKYILRQLIKNKLYSIISILGLGIGLGCVIMMLSFIVYEYSYDKHLPDSDRLYRLVEGQNAKVSYPLGETLKHNISRIEKICTFYPMEGLNLIQKETKIKDNRIIFSNSEIINLMGINLLSQTQDNPLKDPNGVLISEKFARKFFPDTDPIHQIIRVELLNTYEELQVAGIFESFPSNSTLQTDLIGSIDLVEDLFYDFRYDVGVIDEKSRINIKQEWDFKHFHSYVLLNPKTDPSSVEKECSDLLSEIHQITTDKEISLQPVRDIYLKSEQLENAGFFKESHMNTLKIFLGIAIIILLVATFNYLSISITNSKTQLREITCRKIHGASKNRIRNLILTQSVFVAIISLLPSIVIIAFLQPVFVRLVDGSLPFDIFLQFKFILLIVLLTVSVGLLSGLYLSILSSRYNPIVVLKKQYEQHNGKSVFTGTIMAFQFIVFITLFSCSLVMHRQLSYIENKDLGLNAENLIIVPVNPEKFQPHISSIKTQLESHSCIESCIPTSETIPPGPHYFIYSWYSEQEGKTFEQGVLFFGKGLVETLDIPILEGESFHEYNTKDTKNILVNQAAAKAYSLGVGDKLSEFKVVGVLADFHSQSLHQSIKPLVIVPQTQNFTHLVIRTNGNNTEASTQVQTILKSFSPDYILEYEMLTDEIASLYENEIKQLRLLNFFSSFAMLLSCFGLFGFVSLTLLKRTKEIGIRKVNGARIFKLITMLNYKMIIGIIIAFIIATPIAWLTMNRWLSGFAYRINLDWWVFGLAGIIVLGIALITVSWHIWQTASRNPVEALRYE